MFVDFTQLFGRVPHFHFYDKWLGRRRRVTSGYPLIFKGFRAALTIFAALSRAREASTTSGDKFLFSKVRRRVSKTMLMPRPHRVARSRAREDRGRRATIPF
jgi:hypothetical protein